MSAIHPIAEAPQPSSDLLERLPLDHIALSSGRFDTRFVKAGSKTLRQVAALPTQSSPEGIWRVLLITSRETRRWIIPKGWPMKGLKDWDAAAIEARQEAGVLGKVSKKPIGIYPYFKRLADHFDLIEVTVYPLLVTRQLEKWPEREERTSLWLTPGLAADRVDEPELAMLIREADLGAALRKVRD